MDNRLFLIFVHLINNSDEHLMTWGLVHILDYSLRSGLETKAYCLRQYDVSKTLDSIAKLFFREVVCFYTLPEVHGQSYQITFTSCVNFF